MTDSQAALRDRLNSAKRVVLTDEENKMFASNPPYWMAKISERTGVPLSSGRVAHAPAMKCLMVVD
jgi:hypothetical protein